MVVSSLTLFIPPPVMLTEVAWHDLVSRNRPIVDITYFELCKLAGIKARVTGPDLDRRILVLAEGGHATKLRDKSLLAVSMPSYKGRPSDALQVLEVLAYGFIDYAAREAVRGQVQWVAPKKRGRPRSGKALAGAERMRRWRALALGGRSA